MICTPSPTMSVHSDWSNDLLPLGHILPTPPSSIELIHPSEMWCQKPDYPEPYLKALSP